MIVEIIEKCNNLSNYIKSQALSSIASALAQSGKIDEAIQAAKSIDDDSDRSQVLSTIASVLAQSGKIDEATKLFEEVIRAARSIDNSDDRSQAITKIIIMQLKSEIGYSKDLIKMITTNIGKNLFDIVSNSLNVTQDLWNYTIKQCVDYPEITF